MADKSIDEKDAPKKRFSDSWVSLALWIAFIVLARTLLLEPFKIPSGSMEPTLIGHEDFGDRILTNKLAYVSNGVALLTAVAFVLLILQGLIWTVQFYRNETDSRPVYVWIFLVGLRILRSFRFSFYLPIFDWIGLALLGLIAAHTVYWYARNFKHLKEYGKSVRWALIFLVLVLGGMSYAWMNNAVAAEPRRFDVVVFDFNSGWDDDPGKIQDINYIKRLVGLPGDRIMIAGGDLFLYDKEKWNIIRKWQERDDALQEALWFPVSKSFEPHYSDPYSVSDKDAAQLIKEIQDLPPDASLGAVAERMKTVGFRVPAKPDAATLITLLKEVPIVHQQLRDLNFPWKGAEEGAAGVKLEPKALVLDGSAPVELTYKNSVSNIYLKQGRWPFTHFKCPMSHLPEFTSKEGVVWRNPNSTSEDMEAMVSNTWDGIQCPNCRRIYFPVQLGPNSDGTAIRPRTDKRFFYGGSNTVGDLRITLKLELESFGSLRLECGNTLRRAVWNIPGGGETDANDTDGNAHFVQKRTAALSPGEHTLTLAYVDASVIATLDGVEVERRTLSVQPVSENLNDRAESIARINLTGIKGRIVELNLSRDLYYTTKLQGSSGALSHRATREGHRFLDGEYAGNLEMNVMDGEYLMMGDNSPSSKDGRVWGFVPRERMMGRAWIVGWPLSRCKVIK